MTHPLDAISKGLPPGRAVLLNELGLIANIVDYPLDRRITGAEIEQLPMRNGIWVRRERETLRMTQDELAKKIGVTNTTVSRWETGRLDIPLSQIIKLEAVFGRWTR